MQFQVHAGPVVTLPNGKIEGISATTLRNKIPFYAYMGIPFAAAPVGKLRFQVRMQFVTCYAYNAIRGSLEVIYEFCILAISA